MEDTIKKLGYIYVTIDNGDGEKLKREKVLDTHRMGNNFIVQTEHYGVIIFKKAKEVVKGNNTFYAKASQIPQLEKREYNKYHSLRDRCVDKILDLEDDIRNLKREVKWYDDRIADGFQSKFVDVDKYIEEDREKIIEFQKQNSESDGE